MKNAALLMIAAALIAATGCQPVEIPDPCSSFSDPATPAATPATYPKPTNPCPDGYCPVQPVQTFGQEIESATSRADAVDGSAAVEVKSQCPTCPTCPNATPPRPQPRPKYSVPMAGHRLVYVPGQPPIRLAPGERFVGFVSNSQPAAAPAVPKMPSPDEPDAAASPCPGGQCPIAEQPREGVFACQRCGRDTVGSEWHEVWADDGTPLTCLCDTCWNSIDPNERSEHLERYARRTIGSFSPIVAGSIQSAAMETESPSRHDNAGQPPAKQTTWGKQFK